MTGRRTRCLQTYKSGFILHHQLQVMPLHHLQSGLQFPLALHPSMHVSMQSRSASPLDTQLNQLGAEAEAARARRRAEDRDREADMAYLHSLRRSYG